MDKLNFANTDNSLKYNDDIWMTIKENGNIGIGNENPSYTLDVSGSVNVSGNVKFGKISDLSGINSATPSKGEHLIWNDASGNWKPGINTNWKKNNDNWYYDGSGVAIGREELGNWREWTSTVFGTGHNLGTGTYRYSVMNHTYIVVTTSNELIILLLDGTVKQTISLNSAYGVDISEENRIIVGQNGQTKYAYIYELDGNNDFVLTKTLQTINENDVTTDFGRDCAIYGNYAIVGDENSTVGSLNWAGAAYIFERDSNDNWTQKAKLIQSSGRAQADQFGGSVDIYDNHAIVSNRGKSSNAGIVYVFERNNSGNWVDKQTLVSDDLASGDYFGTGVALYKNNILISARGDATPYSGSGSVYFFELENGTWTQKKKFSGEYQDDALGEWGAVDIHENYAIVGAEKYNTFNQGKVWLYERSKSGVWNIKNTYTGAEQYTGLGTLVAIHENYAFFSNLQGAGNNYRHEILENVVVGIYNSAVEGNAHVENELHVGDNVGINVVPPEYKLHVNGEARTTSSWSTSDDRLKHNEQSLTTPLDTIMKLEPKHYFKTKELYDISHNFTLDASGYPVDFSNNRLVEGKDYTRETGIIAQDIQKIPELAFSVRESDYGERPMAVNYNNIHCTHIAATKELNVKLESLSVKNTELKAKNSELKESLEQIKQHLAN